MRLASTAHTSRPWRIHELTGDFRLEDVWALPGESGPGDLPRLVRLFASYNPSRSSSRAVRTLFAIRWKLGELFGWDGPGDGLGSRVPTLRDRLPADLREVPSGPQFATGSFSSLYLIEDEWAAGGRQPDRARGKDARVVHQHIQAAKRRTGLVHHPVDRLRVGQIGLDHGVPAA